jgi:hypothetical protein
MIGCKIDPVILIIYVSVIACLILMLIGLAISIQDPYLSIYNDCINDAPLSRYSDTYLKSAYKYYESKGIHLNALEQEIDLRNEIRRRHTTKTY